MNVDTILKTLNDRDVEYLLIGGMNFLLRHKPILTYDIDIWIDDTSGNRKKCEKALAQLGAEWGTSKDNWTLISRKKSGWTATQDVFCLTSPYGAIDVFRHVKGLNSWSECNRRAYSARTVADIPYRGLSDKDMLKAQYALDRKDRNQERIKYLEKICRRKGRGK